MAKVKHSGLSREEETEWASLWERTRLMFDSQKEESHRRRLAAAEKKLKRMEMAEPPVDLSKIKRALLEFSRVHRYVKSLQTAGVEKRDMVLAFELWPISKAVYEFLDWERGEMHDLEVRDRREELYDLAMNHARGDSKVAAKMLERMDRKNFGDDEEKGRGERVQVNYNLPNLTLAWISPGGKALPVPQVPVQAIDVPAVK